MSPDLLWRLAYSYDGLVCAKRGMSFLVDSWLVAETGGIASLDRKRAGFISMIVHGLDQAGIIGQDLAERIDSEIERLSKLVPDLPAAAETGGGGEERRMAAKEVYGMSFDWVFEPMGAQQLEERVGTLVEGDFVAVTLVNGDLLLGGIAERRRPDDGGVDLSFNTAEGKRYAHSQFIQVPFDSIAGMSVIPLGDASTPRMDRDDPDMRLLREILGDEGMREFDTSLPPRWYPNPLASIIHKHNMQVASSHGMTVGGYMEMALSQDAIAPKGIKFDDDVTLYIDWPFFLQRTPGPTTVGAGIPGLIEISHDVSQSTEAQVLQRLRASLADTIRQKTSPTLGEKTLKGSIVVPEHAQTTDMEGEKCLLLLAEDQNGGESCPVLVKAKCFRYPLEFLPLVKSALTFYGELLPVPVVVLDREYEKTLLARAIAYLHTDE